MSKMLLDNKSLDILMEFSSNYGKRIYGSEIIKKNILDK